MTELKERQRIVEIQQLIQNTIVNNKNSRLSIKPKKGKKTVIHRLRSVNLYVFSNASSFESLNNLRDDCQYNR